MNQSLSAALTTDDDDDDAQSHTVDPNLASRSVCNHVIDDGVYRRWDPDLGEKNRPRRRRTQPRPRHRRTKPRPRRSRRRCPFAHGGRGSD